MCTLQLTLCPYLCLFIFPIFLNVQNPSTYVSILERILDLYDDPLQEFNVIAINWKRSRFGHSLYDPYSSESRRIREFFGRKLVDCLNDVDFEKVDMMLLKETFRYTLSWKLPEIQRLILSKISDDKRPELLTSDNLYCSDPIVFDLIRVDDLQIAEVVLSEIIKVNPQMLLALSGDRRSALEVSLSSDRFNIMDKIFDSIKDESLLRQYINCDWGAFKQIYEYRKMTRSVQRRLCDQDVPEAVFAAVQYDEDMEFTNSLLERVSSEEEKRNLLRAPSAFNWTVFAKAARYGNRQIMEYLMNDIIKNNRDDIVHFYLEPDFAFRTPLGQMVDDTLNFDIFKRALMTLEPEERLQQLLWEESKSLQTEGGCILSRSKTPRFQEDLRQLVVAELRNMKGSISDIAMALLQSDGHQGHCEELHILNQLFDHGMMLSDEEYLQLVLSKTPKTLKYKLLVNYEGGWSYNRIKNVMDGSDQKKQRMVLDLLLNHFDSGEVKNALRDVGNPHHHPTTVLMMICSKGDAAKFRTIQNIYEKAKIPIEKELFAIDHEGGSLLHRAMDKACDIPQQIFRAMDSDVDKMKMINQRRKTDGKCLLDLAQSSSSKQNLKKMVSGIVGNVEKTEMEYSDFIPYFQWLIKEQDLDAIKELLTTFGSVEMICKFISALIDGKRNAFHIACANAKDNHQVVQYLLSKSNDQNLRTLLMAKDNTGSTPLRYISKKHRLFILKYVRDKDRKLLKDLILDSNAKLLTDCLSSARDLIKIFKFCDDSVLSDRSLIVQLSFGVDWSSENDEIRELIVDTANGKIAEPATVSQIPLSGIGGRSTQIGLILQDDAVEPDLDADLSQPDEVGVMMRSRSTNHMDYVDPFLDPNDYTPIVDTLTGDSSLALCLMADNRKLFDMIMTKLDEESNSARYLTEYSNYKGSTLLHMAARRKTKRNEYCKEILDKALTPENRYDMLHARDIDGNTVMHFIATHATYYAPDENEMIWKLMRESLGKKKNATKFIRLLFQYNEVGTTAMNLFVGNLMHFSNGYGLFKDLVMNKDQKTLSKYDIPVFARLLNITISRLESTTEILEIVRFTKNRFSSKLKPKLIKYSGMTH